MDTIRLFMVCRQQLHGKHFFLQLQVFWALSIFSILSTEIFGPFEAQRHCRAFVLVVAQGGRRILEHVGSGGIGR